MMYQNKMVATVKANGRILREVKDTVYLPFGTEFSVLLKNLNSVRASVNISIDGVDVTEGISLVVNPNSEFDLQRYIKNGNVSLGNKFKFIERSGAIEQVRNNKIDDGLIRVSFKFEKPAPQFIWNNTPQYGIRTPITYPNTYPYTTFCVNGNLTSAGGAVGVAQSAVGSAANCSYTDTNGKVSSSVLRGVAQNALVKSDIGITVPGSISDQQFVTVSDFPLETEEHVMVLKMLGETEEGNQILQPVTVKAKPKCVTCQKVNKATAKFCSACGTSLVIV